MLSENVQFGRLHVGYIIGYLMNKNHTQRLFSCENLVAAVMSVALQAHLTNRRAWSRVKTLELATSNNGMDDARK